jgi:hypothetical protein
LGFLAASPEAEWIRVHMSTQDDDATSVAPKENATQQPEALPRPPMLWLLIPVALLGLLVFLSRN